MKVSIISPPKPKHYRRYRWYLREHNCAQVRGDVTNPCLALSIVSTLSLNHEIEIAFLDLQLEEGKPEQVFEKHLTSFQPDLVIVLMSAYAIQEERMYAEKHPLTVSVITPTNVNPKEAIEQYSLKCPYFTFGYAVEQSLASCVQLFLEGHREFSIPGIFKNGSTENKAVPCGEVQAPLMTVKGHEIIQTGKYLRTQTKTPVLYLFTQKGCLFHCIYCTVGSDQYRLVSGNAEKLVSQIAWLKENYKFDQIVFLDADFIADKKFFNAFVEAIVPQNLQISYSANCTINTLNEATIEGLLRSGCQEIRIGIETVNKDLLKVLRKSYQVDRARDILSQARQKGLNVLLYFTTGIPGENKAHLLENIHFLLDTGIKKFTNGNLFPIPSTDFYAKLKQENNLIESDWRRYYLGKTLTYKNGSNMSLRRLKTMQYWMRAMYYFQRLTGKSEWGTPKTNVLNILSEVFAIGLKYFYDIGSAVKWRIRLLVRV